MRETIAQKQVLIVDDEKNVVSSIRRICRGQDYEVITALSGPEALSLLESHHVQVLVSDQRMPGMSGDALFEIVEEKYPHITRVLLTGYTALEGITKAVNNGSVYKIIYKPWHNDDLLNAIESAFEYHDIRKAQSESSVAKEKLLETLNDKVHELDIYNKRLELSMRLSNYLPIALIGVSEDLFIVEANNEANNLFKTKRLVGQKLNKCLPKEIFTLVKDSYLAELEERISVDVQMEDTLFKFTCLRLELSSRTHSFLIYGERSHDK